jgi:hypothetical protein
MRFFVLSWLKKCIVFQNIKTARSIEAYFCFVLGAVRFFNLGGPLRSKNISFFSIALAKPKHVCKYTLHR